MPKKKLLIILLFLCTWLAITVSLTTYASNSMAANPNIPPPNYKVAFIGDTGYGTRFGTVLDLIKQEEAQMVLHQGDFDYADDPGGFIAQVDAALGSDFPYLGSIGNHDDAGWPSDCGKPGGCYTDLFKAHMAANGMVPDDPDLDDEKYAVTFQGLRMVFVGQNGNNDEFAQFLNDQLGVDDQAWKICSWHKNQNAMQLGTKSNEMGWAVYENCINMGALIMTGHEHSYSRTRTLLNAENQTVDPDCSQANAVCVEEGKSFVVVSGLGGKSVRNQDRCLPYLYPYGCNQEWANIYTSDQGASHKYGALFITFHVDGDPFKARGYFKNIDGEIIDEFVITLKSKTPPPTATPTATPSPTADPSKPQWQIHLPFIKVSF